MPNGYFIAKMAGLILILLLEIRPMVTLIKWRAASARGTLAFPTIAPSARRVALISYTQAAIGVVMGVLAVSMAHLRPMRHLDWRNTPNGN